MLNVTLIDDEPESINVISSLIKMYSPDVNILGTYTDPFEGLKAIQEKKPDVLLLDIEMPSLTGLELLKALPQIDFEVIFITAYNQYAINAIKLCALDYLLKPVDPEELANALLIALKKVEEKNTIQKFELLIDLLKNNENTNNNQDHTIALPTLESLEFVKMKNIIRIKADKNYCTFFLAEGESIIISKNIGTYEGSLDEYDFMRIHRSHIINLRMVKRYLHHDGGEVELVNGIKIPVSSPKKEKLIERLKS